MTDTFVPTETGEWVSENFARLAEIVKDYDHNLELRWIPPDRRTRDDKKPFVVFDTLSNTPVLFANELDNPQQILARLFGADGTKTNVLKDLDAHNKAAEAFKLKKEAEKGEEIVDYIEFLIRSPKNYLIADGKKYDDQRRVIGKAK